MTKKLELSLLGTVVISLNGAEVSAQIPAKSLALLSYLAATGHTHSREKLAGLLWGDKSEAGAACLICSTCVRRKWANLPAATK